MVKSKQRKYTVHELAKLAGITVRTLHHYDQIGLLKPTARTEADYRLYGPAELERLQQILFFKELEFPLRDIKRIIDNPGFNPLETLKEHRRVLRQKARRYDDLVKTVEKTIKNFREQTMPLKDDDLYKGFSREKIEQYKKEVRERYDPVLVAESEKRIGKMSKGRWQGVQQEGEDVARALAVLMDRAPSDPAVQELIARHHRWIENFYPCNAQVYRGLGEMYVSNEEFRAYYEKFAEGLADFMQMAMNYYADKVLAVNN